MSHKEQNLVFKYFDIVEKYTFEPSESLLYEVAEIGRAFVSANYPLENLAELQLEAMEMLHVKHPHLNMAELISFAYIPFQELMLAYGIAYRRTIEAQHKIHTAEIIRQERDKLQEVVNIRTRELLIEKERAVEISQMKSKFLANITHELRTPIHGILSFTQLGLEKITECEEHAVEKIDPIKLKKYLTRIYDSGNRLLVLVNELLDLAKFDGQKFDLDFRETDFLLLLKETVFEFEGLLNLKNITLAQHTPSEDSILVLIDSLKIAQVLRNLIANAIRYSPNESKLQISVILDRKADRLTCSIADEGLGIPEEELEKVFEKFEQSSRTKNKSGGTGLGLSICREIIRAHGGHIWAENMPKESLKTGTIFHFDLPLSFSFDVVHS